MVRGIRSRPRFPRAGAKAVRRGRPPGDRFAATAHRAVSIGGRVIPVGISPADRHSAIAVSQSCRVGAQEESVPGPGSFRWRAQIERHHRLHAGGAMTDRLQDRDSSTANASAEKRAGSASRGDVPEILGGACSWPVVAPTDMESVESRKRAPTDMESVESCSWPVVLPPMWNRWRAGSAIRGDVPEILGACL